MKQTIIAWLCILAAIGCFRCAPNPHAAEHADNAAIGVQHQLALDACLNNAVATWQTTQDFNKANGEYVVCADAADKKYAP